MPIQWVMHNKKKGLAKDVTTNAFVVGYERDIAELEIELIGFHCKEKSLKQFHLAK
jgi:hypothetical protein